VTDPTANALIARTSCINFNGLVYPSNKAPEGGVVDIATARLHPNQPNPDEALPFPQPPGEGEADASDARLVQACLQGDEGAWAKLIGRYRNLIYSFPRRYGAGPADAADVFQLVCAEIFVALPRLRNHSSVRAWIVTVAAHQAYHWKRGFVKRVLREGEPPEVETSVATTLPSVDLEMAEREQVMRQAVAQLPPRCRELVQLLFYEDPPVPYHVLAERLGLATGSIGLTRSRCLKKLEQILSESGMSNAAMTERC